MKEEIPVYELFILDEMVEGLTAMGFVNIPAIQQDFLYFNKNMKSFNKYNMSELDTEKRIVVGPAIIPDKKIIREDMFGDLYYVNFTVELVERLAHDFLKESNQHTATEQHEVPIKEVYMIESWIVKNENDKIFTEYGYDVKDVHIGTWCVMYKIDNDDIIDKIKSGEINGFSIEAFLSERLPLQSMSEQLINKIDKLEDKQFIIDLLTGKKTD